MCTRASGFVFPWPGFEVRNGDVFLCRLPTCRPRRRATHGRGQPLPNLASPPRLLGIGNSSSLSPRRRFLQFLSSHCKQARINTGSVHFIAAHCAFVVYYYTIDRVYPLGALFPLFEHSFFLTNFFCQQKIYVQLLNLTGFFWTKRHELGLLGKFYFKLFSGCLKFRELINLINS